MDARALDPVQLDALREVANIGAGHAATALSEITARRVMIEVPDVAVVPLEAVGGLVGAPEEHVCAVLCEVYGAVTGRTVQVLSQATASRLTAKLLRTREPLPPSDFGLIERSALKEIGNILVAAYLGVPDEEECYTAVGRRSGVWLTDEPLDGPLVLSVDASGADLEPYEVTPHRALGAEGERQHPRRCIPGRAVGDDRHDAVDVDAGLRVRHGRRHPDDELPRFRHR